VENVTHRTFNFPDLRHSQTG